MEYSLADIKLICIALREKTPDEIWKSEKVTAIKARIKAHRRATQDEFCCYCRKTIKGIGNIEIHLDHILPKGIFKNCIFELENLACSCATCNLYGKGRKKNFLRNDLKKLFTAQEKHKYFQKEHYLFPHPVLEEDIDSHYIRTQNQHGKAIVIKYLRYTEEGEFAYHFFDLKKYEIESMDVSQGVQTPISRRNEARIEELKNIINKNS